MYAVIETGGKQYKVRQGDVITVEKLKDVEPGDKVTFENVLLISGNGEIQVGTPFLDTRVSGKVVENGRGKKIVIFKYKAKKNYRKKQGHRQPFTKVEITGIGEEKTSSEAKTDNEAKVTPVTAEENKEKSETVDKKTTGVSMSMKKDEIIAFAKENNIEIDEKAKKQELVDAIKEALK